MLQLCPIGEHVSSDGKKIHSKKQNNCFISLFAGTLNSRSTGKVATANPFILKERKLKTCHKCVTSPDILVKNAIVLVAI